MKVKNTSLHLFDEDHNAAVEVAVAESKRVKRQRRGKGERTVYAVANGLGAPSILMTWCMCVGLIPGDVTITAHTGAENDRLVIGSPVGIGQGQVRMSAPDYFSRFVLPLCAEFGKEAVLVRTTDRGKTDLPSLWDEVRRIVTEAYESGEKKKLSALKIPLFGSNGGRLTQVCTDKWKIRAIQQEARRRGAGIIISAQGLHYDELWRRAKGGDAYVMPYGGKEFYVRKSFERKKDGKQVLSKWMQHYYPFEELRAEDIVPESTIRGALYRARIREVLEYLRLPFINTSECDFCPHQDYYRWTQHTPEMIAEIAEIEAMMLGEFFFTDLRIPLPQALEVWRERVERNPSLLEDLTDFGCGNAVCGV